MSNTEIIFSYLPAVAMCTGVYFHFSWVLSHLQMSVTEVFLLKADFVKTPAKISTEGYFLFRKKLFQFKFRDTKIKVSYELKETNLVFLLSHFFYFKFP